MRIRKIKEKDIYAVTALMRNAGIQMDTKVLSERLRDFQYKRNHAVVVLEKQGKILSMMHMGVEPSLLNNREACVFSLFIADQIDKDSIEKHLLSYGDNWAKLHGCDAMKVYDNNVFSC